MAVDRFSGDTLPSNRLLLLALLLSGQAAAQAATPVPCPTAVQARANRALQALDQRQQAEDTQLRNHPTASYATMNGPVVRELEKRKQRERLAANLQSEAAKQNYCQLQGPDF